MKIEVLGWVIEQAKGANCATLTAFSDLVIENPGATYEVWTRSFKLQTNIESAVNAMVGIIKNPYSTIVTSNVTSASYADIAYIASSILASNG